MRYARLKNEWVLRGWADEPHSLLNFKTGDCRQLSEQMFLLAQACDGLTDLAAAAGFIGREVFLDKLIAAGMAEECGQGEEILPYQRFRKADNAYIRTVHWLITGLCNLKCRHCYMEAPAGTYGELPLPDILRIIDRLAAANVHHVHLTGGEPFLRQDLADILAALAARQITVTHISTNGALVTDEALQNIKKLGFSPHFQISFDGYGAHDAMRGVPGAERAAVQAIRRLRGHGFPVAAATVVDRANAASLPETYAVLKRMDIQSWLVGLPEKIGNWRDSETELAWEEALAAYAAVADRWSADGRPFELKISGFDCTGKIEEFAGYGPESYDCMSCRLTPTLLPDGTIIPCPGYIDIIDKKRMPNILRQSFAAALSSPALRAITDIRKKDVLAHNAACAACAEFPRCGGGCRASAATATGDLMGVNPHLCRQYKAGR